MVWLLAIVAVIALAMFRWARIALVWLAGLALLGGVALALVVWAKAAGGRSVETSNAYNGSASCPRCVQLQER